MWIPELGSSTEHERAAVAFTDLLRDALGGLVRSERVLAASGSAGMWDRIMQTRSPSEQWVPFSSPLVVLAAVVTSVGFASPNGMMVQADGSWCDVSSRQEMRSAAEYREPVSVR